MPAHSAPQLAQAKTSPNKKGAIQKAANNEGARLIADENGMIIFKTDEFASLSGGGGLTLGDYFHDDILAQLNNDHLDLKIVTIKDTSTKLALQFDWIDMPSASGINQRYLVASAEEVTAGAKLKEFVSEKIAQSAPQSQNQSQAQINPYPFMDMSHDACLVSDFDGRFFYANQGFCKLLGYNQNDIKDLHFLDLIHEEDRPFVHRALADFRQNTAETFDQETVEDYNAFDFDARTLAKDGTLFWIEWQFKANAEHVFSLGRDITAIKKQKERLLRQQKELSEAEAIAHMGHWRWRAGEENLRFSPEIYRIFGFDNDKEFQPTLDNINAMIHREDSGRMTQVFQRAMIEQNDYDIEFRITRGDGQTRFIRCEGRCEIDDEDDVTALYGIMQDVTETVLREQDLTKAKDSAERAYAAKSQFLANMSHELRTPLNAIIGFSEMMQHQLLGPIGNDKYIEYIAGIRESGEHLLDLISDILDMSKIEAGKYEIALERFNLIKTIKLAMHMMESRASDQKVKLSSALNIEELTVTADRRAIMQVVLNVVSNAVKFTKEQGFVTLNLDNTDTHFTITVEDNGIGIPANKLANITNPFEQVECSYTRQHDGSGLGLAITKELVEAHGGTLKIESQLDVGTTVRIKMPLKAQK